MNLFVVFHNKLLQCITCRAGNSGNNASPWLQVMWAGSSAKKWCKTDSLHLLCEATAQTWVFSLFDIKTHWIRIETKTPKALPQSAMLVPSQTHVHVQACPQGRRETLAGKNDVHTVCCPLRTTSVIDQSHPTSPGLWPLPDSCCCCWWARPNAYRPRWLRQIVCRSLRLSDCVQMGKHPLKQLWEQSSEPSLNIRPLLPAVSLDTLISFFPSGEPKGLSWHSEIWMI